MTLARDLSNSFSLSEKRKRDEPESFVMKIRRTETSWLIQDKGDSVTVPVGPGPASMTPSSLTPVPASLLLPPLVLRKSGSSNWTFLPKVLTFFTKGSSLNFNI